VWIEALVERRNAIVAKIPDSVIKSLYLGAKSSLFVGVINVDPLRILCLGLRVNDEPSLCRIARLRMLSLGTRRWSRYGNKVGQVPAKDAGNAGSEARSASIGTEF
jgi:hypothetical protein